MVCSYDDGYGRQCCCVSMLVDNVLDGSVVGVVHVCWWIWMSVLLSLCGYVGGYGWLCCRCEGMSVDMDGCVVVVKVCRWIWMAVLSL